MVRVESHVELQISPVNEVDDISKCGTLPCACYVLIKNSKDHAAFIWLIYLIKI